MQVIHVTSAQNIKPFSTGHSDPSCTSFSPAFKTLLPTCSDLLLSERVSHFAHLFAPAVLTSPYEAAQEASKTQKASLSIVDHFIWVGVSFLLKNAIGNSFPTSSCCAKHAPIAVADASVYNQNGRPISGVCKVGILTSSSLIFTKASPVSNDHMEGHLVPFFW
ncbi:hypothetical protein AVEN_243182-1 [Araneus ventricosus]|uniref:Uncharacterized protein n=1 Tax=Araneus ventricosus TaxID=182803 RepID=A0A4Y1ZKA0_ARAVE|nr:hypothetical protein AVEN_243182-1 [Araneus ventricosus]